MLEYTLHSTMEPCNISLYITVPGAVGVPGPTNPGGPATRPLLLIIKTGVEYLGK